MVSAHNLTYDAEGHVTAVDGGSTASYIYDAEGRRVRVTLPGQSAWDNIECLYDLEGHCNTKTNFANQQWSMGEVYAAGEHIATYNSGTTFFTTTDWIGTERYRTYPDGTYAESCTSLPFGDGLSCPDDGGISPLHLTGKERDSETGLDYFGARHYSSNIGRFLSPDQAADETIPVALPWAEFNNPQTLNLYSYALNNPISNVDEDGHDVHVCVDNNSGGQNCFNMTDQQYADLQKQQNGQNGIGMPGGSMPNGNITCGGQVCGSATFFEPSVPADDFMFQALSVGGIAKGIGSLAGLARGLFGTAVKEEAGALAGEVIVSGGKEAIRDALEKGAVKEVQKQAIKRALARGAVGNKYTLEKLADGSVKITTEVAGRAGGRATYEKIIDAAGNTVPGSAVQKAYTASGELVHVHGKN